ncbi:similar to Saccharomyces cerevisiae YCL011C GBP2 Poly(A+) RNA-binding protein, involved in the export of mRNAs from the nucleus to the cytoplasm [Maudiozyma barnettii]|uniref:Similar to Saccharomyces cerevisiae YCL011C GBP2 Poly(A+) RNA-binding protein, involved in the export of mRNAs from the nucleus to the cytoplasm n=1 Tax=Maudiozyma barnettii TaxID=61262 RepID=A0A8H2ZJ35_9SACH|nr:single-stranded telomeric DNA-binding/mRNA-binding protein [Kazachstania barnettii]CAB4256553.1 similar to Saccharomyces cerevisiae YCL011C GBP2 Poly(A+) RNA-binding protein, involved in the export of mRNAs from the nucleus to the cytoplasm [Kazachstania barnettii]CAD1785156.1 similar to Saccharomyces cerevisiae YCL011C GBP2 Poly(A+) RNA-binding protein, involved in the export of mRNAs from the nucleus to the cytoplasm [Kazachstania barnettii]
MDQALGDYNNAANQRSRSRSPSRRRMSFDYSDAQGSFGGRPRRARRGGRRDFGGRSGRGGRGSRGGFEYGPSRDSFRDMPARREMMPERIYDNSIFIGNLSFDCTEDDLRDFFQPVGEIVSTEIIRRRGRHKGMGTVEFTNTAAVDEAINRFNNVNFMGRDLFIKQDQPPPNKRAEPLSIHERIQPNDAYEGSNNYDPYYGNQDYGFAPPPPRQQPQQRSPSFEVFIINLPYSFSWQDLKDLFRECGNVQRADIELDYNGYSKGFGNVFYATEEEMFRAIDTFNGYNLQGRILEVREGRSNRQFREPRRESYHEPNDRLIYDEQVPPENMNENILPVEPAPSTFSEGVVGNGERNSLVYCTGLPLSTSVNDLYELFESLGRVHHAELTYDSNGAPTGTAVVDYEDISSADLCVSKLNNYNYGGQDLSVSFAQRTN